MNRLRAHWLVIAAIPAATACASAPPPAAPVPEPPPVAVVATASAQPAASAEPAASADPAAPPPVAKPSAPVRAISSKEWEKLRASGAFSSTSFPQVGTRVETYGPFSSSTTPVPPGAIRLRDCQHGGSSEGFVTERATGAIWLLRTVGGFSAPAGVSMPATRCFDHDHQVPPGTKLAGVLQISYPNHIGH